MRNKCVLGVFDLVDVDAFIDPRGRDFWQQRPDPGPAKIQYPALGNHRKGAWKKPVLPFWEPGTLVVRWFFHLSDSFFISG